jgi:hypothetical protein
MPPKKLKISEKISALLLRVRKAKTRGYIGSRNQAKRNLGTTGWDDQTKQDFILAEKNLSQKLGFNKGEKIDFFAACSGDWARALAEELEVHASDVSKKVVENLKRNQGKIKSVQQRAAEYGAIVPNYFDWTVSFEPYPIFLFSSHGMINTVRMSLINRKGLKAVFEVNTPGLYKRKIRLFAELYEVKLKEETVKIRVIKATERIPKEREMLIFTVETNPKARKKAELDLYVERRKYSMPKGMTLRELERRLAKEFNKSEKEIKESLKRIKLTEKEGEKTSVYK